MVSEVPLWKMLCMKTLANSKFVWYVTISINEKNTPAYCCTQSWINLKTFCWTIKPRHKIYCIIPFIGSSKTEKKKHIKMLEMKIIVCNSGNEILYSLIGLVVMWVYILTKTCRTEVLKSMLFKAWKLCLNKIIPYWHNHVIHWFYLKKG